MECQSGGELLPSLLITVRVAHCQPACYNCSCFAGVFSNVWQTRFHFISGKIPQSPGGAYTWYSHKCRRFFNQEITRGAKLFSDRLLCIRDTDICYADKWRMGVRGNRRSQRKLTSSRYCRQKCHRLTAFSFMPLVTAIFIDRQNKAYEMSQKSVT